MQRLNRPNFKCRKRCPYKFIMKERFWMNGFSQKRREHYICIAKPGHVDSRLCTAQVYFKGDQSWQKYIKITWEKSFETGIVPVARYSLLLSFMEFDIRDEVVNDKELLILKKLICLYMSHFNEWFMAMGRNLDKNI
jgi:hypothetical protein